MDLNTARSQVQAYRIDSSGEEDDSDPPILFTSLTVPSRQREQQSHKHEQVVGGRKQARKKLTRSGLRLLSNYPESTPFIDHPTCCQPVAEDDEHNPCVDLTVFDESNPIPGYMSAPTAEEVQSTFRSLTRSELSRSEPTGIWGSVKATPELTGRDPVQAPTRANVYFGNGPARYIQSLSSMNVQSMQGNRMNGAKQCDFTDFISSEPAVLGQHPGYSGPNLYDIFGSQSSQDGARSPAKAL